MIDQTTIDRFFDELSTDRSLFLYHCCQSEDIVFQIELVGDAIKAGTIGEWKGQFKPELPDLTIDIVLSVLSRCIAKMDPTALEYSILERLLVPHCGQRYQSWLKRLDAAGF